MPQNYGFNKSSSVSALDLEYVHPIGYDLYHELTHSHADQNISASQTKPNIFRFLVQLYSHVLLKQEEKRIPT